jgi:hypothetical protein
MSPFPVYRKLSGFDRFYKITDDRHFTEAFRVQGSLKYQEIEAVQFPEILRIKDMIECQFNYVEMSPEEILEHFPS